ncbi:hypothetical protein PENTCL1PPCAC_18412, partial [Pristionchus entomophagus]
RMRNRIKAFRTRPSTTVSHIDLDVIEEGDEETESDIELFKSLECLENRPKARKARKKVERNQKGKPLRAANWIPEDLSDSDNAEEEEDEPRVDKPEDDNRNEIQKMCDKMNKEFDSFDDFSLPVETEFEAIPMKWDEKKKVMRPMTAIEIAEREEKERLRDERHKQRVIEEKENRREQQKREEKEEDAADAAAARPSTPEIQQMHIPDLRTCLRRMSEMPRRNEATPLRRRVRDSGAVPTLPHVRLTLATNNILDGLMRPHEMSTPGRRETQRRTTVAPRETMAGPLIEEEDEEEMEDRSSAARSVPSPHRETAAHQSQLQPPRCSARTQPAAGAAEGRRTTRSMANEGASLVVKEEIPVMLFSESEEEEEELVGIEEAHSARVEAISARRATLAAAQPILHSTPVRTTSQEPRRASARLSRLAGVSPIRRRDSAPLDDVINDEDEEEGGETMGGREGRKTGGASLLTSRLDEKDEKMSVESAVEEEQLAEAVERSMILEERRPPLAAIDETAATLQATMMGNTVAGSGTILFGENTTMGGYGDGTVAVTLAEERDTLMIGDEASLLPYAAAAARGSGQLQQPTRRTTMGNETLDVSMASVASYATQRNASMMSRRNVSQITNESAFADELPFYLRDFVGESALEQLLYVVGQERVQEWRDQLPKDTLVNLRKLGEGTYGEVFATTMNGAPVAMKIIPFEDEMQYYDGVVNGETLKSTAEILPEILITRELSSLNNDSASFSTSTFIPLAQCHVVKGNYPDELLKEWDAYDKRKGSENDRPSEYACPDALFVAIGLAMGGVDVESYKVKNEGEALSALFQLALALVVAENELEFEHRDLHIGNALIAQVPEDEEIKYRLLGRDVYVKSHGVKLSIIDFTNSRLRKEGTTIFLDLEQDEELFQGQGDYQFDIYRLMRQHNKGNWRDFCPKSNIFWLHYMATELILEERKKGLAKGFTKKRRRELFSVFDSLPTHDEIKAFLYSGEVYDIMQEFVRFEEAE